MLSLVIGLLILNGTTTLGRTRKVHRTSSRTGIWQERRESVGGHGMCIPDGGSVLQQDMRCIIGEEYLMTVQKKVMPMVSVWVLVMH